MARKIFVFDTETTGLPPRGGDVTNSVSWERCRIVQIAWHVYDERGGLQEKHNIIVRPDGFTIPDRASDIHGITTETAMNIGRPFSEVVSQLQKIIPLVDTVVAHNIRFDNLVLLSELHRYGSCDLIDEWNKKTKKCTMIMGTPPKCKWPKLGVLYEQLFGEAPKGRLHDADVDVELCAQCYFRLVANEN
jgi:DNA polymerase III epsilon subunit-like protein